MRILKKITAVCMAALMAVVGMGQITVNAASWSASHANYPGAPSNEGTVTSVKVVQNTKGVLVTCNYNTHTNPKATKGYTYISCPNYTMSKKRITNLNKVTCVPAVGKIKTEIAVLYRITAHTPTSNDTFNSKGTIVKIK